MEPTAKAKAEIIRREGKEMLVLGNATRYKTPLKLRKSLTMAGQYMTKRMFEELRATG